jgi:hypothetical protein
MESPAPPRTDGPSVFDSLLAEMHAEAATGDFFAYTLLGTPEGKVRWSWQSAFAGFDESDESRRELRKPCLVDGAKMSDLWRRVGQRSVTVRKPAHFAIFLRLGGNAVLDAEIARRFLKEQLEPSVAARDAIDGAIVGYRTLSGIPEDELRRTPTPKQRMRILRRDHFRCRLCGRSPNDDVHAMLEVHHSNPFADGGLTSDENLITLCLTCHRGLEPHWSLAYDRIASADFGTHMNEEFRAGVAAYRRIVADLLPLLSAKDAGAST